MADGEIQEENGRCIDGQARNATKDVDVLCHDDAEKEKDEVA